MSSFSNSSLTPLIFLYKPSILYNPSERPSTGQRASCLIHESLHKASLLGLPMHSVEVCFLTVVKFIPRGLLEGEMFLTKDCLKKKEMN